MSDDLIGIWARKRSGGAPQPEAFIVRFWWRGVGSVEQSVTHAVCRHGARTREHGVANDGAR